MGRRYRKFINVIILVIVLLGLIDVKVSARVYDANRNFKRITIEDGLSQGSAYKIYQDSKGYMWIGTGDGLNRYNGHRFEVFKHSTTDEDTISGNRVTDIVEDNEGNLWVGTNAGLNKIDLETKKIKRYLPNEDGCNISNYIIRAIMVTKNGDVLVGTNDGLNIYDKESDNFNRIYDSTKEENGLSNEEVYALTEDENGNYWVGTKKGLNKINSNTGEIRKYFAEESSISHNFIYSLHADGAGTLWVGTYYGGLNKLNLKTGDVKIYMPSEKNNMPGAVIRDLIIDSRDILWIVTDFGFARFNEEDNSFTPYKSSKYNSGSIISDETLSVYEDQSGAIWIGTNYGISMFNPENMFNYYKSDPFNDNSLSTDDISGIYEDDDGVLWIGTIRDGLNIFDRKNNEIIRVDAWEDYPGEFLICDNLVRDITGIDNEIWIATQNGLDKYDKTIKQRTGYDGKDGLACQDIKSLCIDSDGILWIGTRDGIFSTDRNGNFINHSESFKEAGIEVLSFNDIYEDEEGILWMSADTKSGLIRFDKTNNEIKTYSNFNQIDSKNKSYNLILSINLDYTGNIWLGTDSGLIKFNKRTEEFVRYTEEDGLANNFIYGMLFEDENHLWLSTNYGISKFDIHNEKFINFDTTDGVQGLEFNQYSYFKSKGGEMFFGGTNGLTSFYPNQIKEKTFIPKVQIDDLHNIYSDKLIDGKMELGYKENQFHFHFFMPDYTNKNKIKYEYMLEGIDKEWIIAEDDRSATYTNLKPGNYNFKVIARNSSGQWSKPNIINISIGNPPWQTPFAYLIYSIVIVAITYIIWNRVNLLEGLVKQRTAELNNKLEENEELYTKLLIQERYKNNYFVNLSHELRTPLNVIFSAQNLISSLHEQNIDISKEKMDYYMKSIKKNCTRLLNLIENIINTSKIEAGSYRLNIKECDIVYLVEEVALSMKGYIEEKGVQLILDPYVEEKIIECDEVEIERVIINLLSNAIKFTDKGGKIEVYIWDLRNKVKISVRDSGVGIAPKYHKTIFDRFSQAYSDTSEEHGGSGLGLTFSKNLIELHGGNIFVKSELGKGSEFVIILPVKQ